MTVLKFIVDALWLANRALWRCDAAVSRLLNAVDALRDHAFNALIRIEERRERERVS